MVHDRNSKNFSFPSQLGILLGLIGAGLVIGGLLSVIVWSTMTGRPFTSMEADMSNPAYYYPLMVIQGVTTLFMFFLPVYFFAMICYRSPSRFIGFDTPINFRQILWLLVILALTFPLGAALAELNKIIPIPASWEIKFKAMEASRATQEAALININSLPKYLMSLFIIALLPGLFEEVCFRGGLQNILTRWLKGPVLAILLTAFIFSAIHMSYYGFLVRFALGLILGYIFYYSGSIWLGVLFHFLFNGIQVTALYVSQIKPGISGKDVEDNFPVWVGLLALSLLWFAFKRFRTLSLEAQQKFKYEEVGDPNDFHNWLTQKNEEQ